jgi:hypothetical protein
MIIKKLFIISLFLTSNLSVKAQTLKITDVKSSDDRMYKSASDALGKNLLLEVYDSSVRIIIADDKKPLILKEVSKNRYFGTTEQNDNEAWKAELSIDTTIGVITSATLTVTVSEKNKGINGRSASCTLTAKRF